MRGPFQNTGRALLLGIAVFLILGIGLFTTYHGGSAMLVTPPAWSTETSMLKSPPDVDRFHFLLPASNANVDLCKTLVTAAVVGFPAPTLIAWNQTFDQGNLLGGGSHVAKITGVLEYLQGLDSSEDDRLVFMVDAYDIWFQLRSEVLIARYHSIVAAANQRLRSRLGHAVEAEDLKETIIFGAGKRCAPNQVHTVACYPIPASPLPDDLYGPNTDTIMGRNKYTSLKQRYLNSGYIIGPVKDMRRMFQRAQEKVEALKDFIEWDNGSHGSDFMYHGSDQSIFNIILGEQEFQREVMRRRHSDKADKSDQRMPLLHIEGTIIEDPLSPNFTHEPMEHKKGRPDEFGITLDYFSELGQQTVNSEEDSRWVRYNESITEQVETGRHIFDCPSRLTGVISDDISDSRRPFESLTTGDYAESTLYWNEVKLYTNLCLDRIPVMIHHNGDKSARGWAWPSMWIYSRARELMDGVLAAGYSVKVVNGDQAISSLAWDRLCPASLDPELYG